MHFDDRLDTVLRPRSGGPAVARIQYRQLLDLLGTLSVDAQGPQVDTACDRLAELSRTIGTAERAAMVRDRGLRLRNPRLIVQLAADEPAVALAAIESAQLREDEWIDLAPALPIAARGLLRSRRDLGDRALAVIDRLGVMRPALPPAKAELPVQAAAPISVLPVRPAPPAPEGIGAIVKRIEDFRKARQPAVEPSSTDSPRLPLGETAPELARPPIQAFDFATDFHGEFVWADPGMAPLAVGMRLSLLEEQTPGGTAAGLSAKVRARQPIERLVTELAGAPAISGRWQIDAAPCFDPQSGRFTGYAGRMRRIVPELPDESSAGGRDSEADRMRQVLHELRTPVNAIQGFAEVIQQQLFGPTPHEYRALAAAIAADAARMLAGFEELDRLARLESGTMPIATGTSDLGESLAATIDQLTPFTQSRNGGFRLETGDGLALAMDRSESDRLVWRLLATLAGTAHPGEVLPVTVTSDRGMIEARLQLPASLALQGDDALLNALAGHAPKALSAGMFGIGFSLRLAGAEARAAGGSLDRQDGALCLRLPKLAATQAEAGLSGDAGSSPR